MNRLQQIFQNLRTRNLNLPDTLQQLKFELENCFSEKIQEAGVINPGYYSYFLPILEKYRNSSLILKYHISEEQHSDSYTGNLIKVPCVDIFSKEDQYSSIRLFIIPNNLYKI